MSEARFLAFTNPKYENRLFIELRVHYKKTSSSEMMFTQIVLCFDIQNNLCTQHVLTKLVVSCTELVIQLPIFCHTVG